jgi:hypothetical protein
MEKHLGFRAWYYFRNGWSLYFAFIFAAINTLTVTYYLAIEKIPYLQIIFPSFLHYVGVAVLVGVPFLIIVGYTHYKKTAAFRSEVDISIEVNPYQRRLVVNTEAIIRLNLNLLDTISKYSINEKMSKEDLENITKLKNEISELIESRTFRNDLDLAYFRKIDKKISP